MREGKEKVSQSHLPLPSHRVSDTASTRASLFPAASRSSLAPGNEQEDVSNKERKGRRLGNCRRHRDKRRSAIKVGRGIHPQRESSRPGTIRSILQEIIVNK